jgi:hypothetical protein
MMQSFKTRPGGRPGPRLGFQVLAGSPGLTGLAGSILKKKKSKRRRFSKKKTKKKQKSTGLSPGLDRVLPGHTGFFLPPFFHQPCPVLAPG